VKELHIDTLISLSVQRVLRRAFRAVHIADGKYGAIGVRTPMKRNHVEIHYSSPVLLVRV